MSDKPMTADEALEILLEMVRCWASGRTAKYSVAQLNNAFEFFEGKHVYVSRFKPGDKLWFVYRMNGWHVGSDNFKVDMTDETKRFPTRAEAKAECARRNQEGGK